MKYYIRRDLNEYGPYTLADLQRYVAQGNIALTDLTRSEDTNEWVSVSQVIGNIPPPSPPEEASAPAGYGAGTVPSGSRPYGGGALYSGTPSYGGQPIPAAHGPMPPDLHWGVVLLLGILTGGVFFWVWLLVEGAFVKKNRPQSNGLAFAISAMICSYGGQFIHFFGIMGHPVGIAPFGTLLGLASLGLVLAAVFSMKSDLEEYYNSVEPIHLRLNGVMVFFFAVLYFQYHFSRIGRWKKTGVLEPQS